MNTGFWWGNLSENPGVYGMTILRWIYGKWDWGTWTELIWLRIGTGGGSRKRGNEPRGSIKCGERTR